MFEILYKISLYGDNMVSESVKKTIEEIKSMTMKEARYIELVSTVEYLTNLVEPSKRDMFKKALDDAEDMDDVNEILDALKLQLGAQGAKKLLKL
jgi:transcriptional/translational regulatory protein YebC/TACO1